LLLVLAASASAASAAPPLTLTYHVRKITAGEYRYTFELEVNDDAGWQRGQSFGWLIFGAAQGTTSPLASFRGEDASISPISPWLSFTRTTGQTVGPTLAPGRLRWSTLFRGQTVRWAGTMGTDIGMQPVYWCALDNGGAAVIDMARAVRVSYCTAFDISADGFLDASDYDAFVAAFVTDNPRADVNADGFVDVIDFDAFIGAFLQGCSDPVVGPDVPPDGPSGGVPDVPAGGP
jgi:hypothetical protein